VKFVRACARGELWRGEMKSVAVGGHKLLLVNAEGEPAAFEDRCAHQDAPLSDGTLEGCVLRCKIHGWEFDARSGAGINPLSVRLRRYLVQVEGDDIRVGLPDDRDESAGPVLLDDPLARAVVAALRAENPHAVVEDNGAYVRVLAPRRCVVSRAAIERAAGRPFALPGDLALVMVSFQGRFSSDDDQARWEAGPPT